MSQSVSFKNLNTDHNDSNAPLEPIDNLSFHENIEDHQQQTDDRESSSFHDCSPTDQNNYTESIENKKKVVKVKIEISGSAHEINLCLEEADVPEKIRAAFRKHLTDTNSRDRQAWYSWMQYEQRFGHFKELEALFAEALIPHGDIPMWRLYIDYVLSCNELSTLSDLGSKNFQLKSVGAPEEDAERKRTVSQAYELALANVGLDFHSSPFYREYIRFIRGWQTDGMYEQQQQMDLVRKIYHRAIATPMEGIELLWSEYDAYENGLNKIIGKKIIADHSAAYMAARLAARELSAIIEDTERTYGSIDVIGNEKFRLSKFLEWIRWERGNPLKMPESATLLSQRIAYAFKTALAEFPFQSLIWFEYTRHMLITNPVTKTISTNEDNPVISIFKEAVSTLGEDDVLVNFAYCDYMEELYTHERSSQNQKDSGDSSKSSGPAEDHPHPAKIIYEALIDRLYTTTNRDQEASDRLTLAFVQFMQFCRRVEGMTSARAVFTRARKLTSGPPLTHHIFSAASRMEIYMGAKKLEPAAIPGYSIAGKIYDLGVSRFSNNYEFLIECLYHMLIQLDEQNARSFFERTVNSNKMPQDELVEFWNAYLDHIYMHGDEQTRRLMVSRFRDSFLGHPSANELAVFSRLYSYTCRSGIVTRLAPISPDDELLLSSSSRKLLSDQSIFHIPDTLQSLIDKMPRGNFSGPSIDCDMIIEALLTGLADTPYLYSKRVSTKHRIDIPFQDKRVPKKRKEDVDDAEAAESRNAPTRPDDIFAQRRLK